MDTLTLDPCERDLFTQAMKTGVVNPFSIDREIQNRKLGLAPSYDDPEQALVQGVIRVRQTLDEMDRQERADIRRYVGEDRYVLNYAMLFSGYHEIAPDNDRIIEQYLSRRDQPAMSPPYHDAIHRRLGRYGFSPEEIRFYIGIAFQLRRAYYFVRKNLAGSSVPMRRFRAALWENAMTNDMRFYIEKLHGRMEDFTTLILGETGTGKGLAASAIGQSGFIQYDTGRRQFCESFVSAFLSINLSQFSPALIESELFGHRKGAFTGAIDAHDGVFARSSSNGSIFLDEIGDVPIAVQTKLLQVLQERTFSPVGSHEQIHFAGRVISATNRDIEHDITTGRFREDFYYRLTSDIIRMPSLYERICDCPEELQNMTGHLVQRMVGVENPELSKTIVDTIVAQVGPNYRWPGNVRELEQFIRRITIHRGYTTGLVRKSSDAIGGMIADAARENLDARTVLARYARALFQNNPQIADVAAIMKLDPRTVRKYLDTSD